MAKLRLCQSFLSFLLVAILFIHQSTAKVYILDEDSWDIMLEGEWMVEFYAPWCPACKALGPKWDEFGSWSDDIGIKVGQVDVTESPGLSGRFMVTALPTIYHVKDGVFRQYHGSRETDQFLSYIEEKKWQGVEEVPAWKSPGSYQMSVVAQFFKLSMMLRGVHSVLVKDYGLPEWSSYLIFALATIVLGALIGLILVCIIDFVFPPKSYHDTSAMASRINDTEEDLLESEAVKEEEEEAIVETENGETESQQNSEEDSTADVSKRSVRKRKTRKAD